MINDQNTYFLLTHYYLKSNKLYYLKQYELPLVLTDSLASMLRQGHNIKMSDLTRKTDKHLFQQLISYGAVCKVFKQDEGVINKKEKILFVQSHGDDCVLSCGGLLSGLPGTVSIATIFSDYSIDYFPWKDVIKLNPEKYTVVRKEEDIAAAKYLNTNVIFLDYPEALKRGMAYPISKQGLLKKEQKFADELYLNMLRVIEDIKPDKVFFPAGIGWHIDHQLCFSIAEKILNLHEDLSGKLYLYEDYPYCNNNRYDYCQRHLDLQNQYRLAPHYVNIEENLNAKSTLINFYKSQFRNWSFQHIKKDISEYAKAIAIEAKFFHGIQLGYVFAERFWKINQK